jgi:hypothetical protein
MSYLGLSNVTDWLVAVGKWPKAAVAMAMAAMMQQSQLLMALMARADQGPVSYRRR